MIADTVMAPSDLPQHGLQAVLVRGSGISISHTIFHTDLYLQRSIRASLLLSVPNRILLSRPGRISFWCQRRQHARCAAHRPVRGRCCTHVLDRAPRRRSRGAASRFFVHRRQFDMRDVRVWQPRPLQGNVDTHGSRAPPRGSTQHATLVRMSRAAFSQPPHVANACARPYCPKPPPTILIRILRRASAHGEL